MYDSYNRKFFTLFILIYFSKYIITIDKISHYSLSLAEPLFSIDYDQHICARTTEKI